MSDDLRVTCSVGAIRGGRFMMGCLAVAGSMVLAIWAYNVL
jgi:hypothetical protein